MRPAPLDDRSIPGPAEAVALMTSILEASTEFSIIGEDLDGTIVLWNEGARRIYGYAPEALVGVANSLILHVPEDVAAGRNRQFVDAALRDGRWEGTVNRVRANGERFVARVVITPRRDSQGEPVGYLTISKDVSGEIRLTEEAYRAVVDTAVDAIIVINEDGLMQSFNPAAERLFGYQADEVIGKSVGQLAPEPHRSAHDGYIGAYRQTGTAKIIGLGREIDAQRKDGTTFPADLSVAEWRMAGKRYFTGIMRDITQRRQAEEHLRLVMSELSHRTKNVLAVVQAIAWQLARRSLDIKDFEERLMQRIQALAISHDILVRGEWRGADLETLVGVQLAPFLDSRDERLSTSGPPALLQPQSAQTFGLALHELATNASKYGALSCATGRIEISWRVDPDPAATRGFQMSWREIGGPAVTPPTRNGFGYAVLKDIMARGFDGEVALEFAPEGFNWRIAAPSERVLAEKSGIPNP